MWSVRCGSFHPPLWIIGVTQSVEKKKSWELSCSPPPRPPPPTRPPLHKELIKMKGHHRHVHSTNLLRRYVPPHAKKSANSLAIHTKVMYMVHSGASLHTIGITFSESQRKEDHSTVKQKFWIFRPPMTLWSQAHKRRSTSRKLALFYGYMWWRMLRHCYRWEDYAIILVVLNRGRKGNSQIIKR